MVFRCGWFADSFYAFRFLFGLWINFCVTAGKARSHDGEYGCLIPQEHLMESRGPHITLVLHAFVSSCAKSNDLSQGRPLSRAEVLLISRRLAIFCFHPFLPFRLLQVIKIFCSGIIERIAPYPCEVYFSLVATVGSIGAAAVPSAGAVTVLIVLNAVGLGTRHMAMILAVDWFM